RAGDERRGVHDLGRTLRLRVAYQRADLDVAVAARDAVEARHGVDVDQQARARQPHVERGDQALPARQGPRALAAEKFDRVLDRARPGVIERRRLHPLPPLTFFTTRSSMMKAGTASATAPPLPACGERVGVRGTFHGLRSAETPAPPPRISRASRPAASHEGNACADATSTKPATHPDVPL